MKITKPRYLRVMNIFIIYMHLHDLYDAGYEKVFLCMFMKLKLLTR